jgi:hypothetical protein
VTGELGVAVFDAARNRLTCTFSSFSYYSALTGQPPFLKWGEFDPDVFHADPSSTSCVDGQTSSNNHPLVPHRSLLINQLLLQSEILAQYHAPEIDTNSEKFISEVEGKWYKWSNDHSRRLLEQDDTEEFYVRVHYHW